MVNILYIIFIEKYGVKTVYMQFLLIFCAERKKLFYSFT